MWAPMRPHIEDTSVPAENQVWHIVAHAGSMRPHGARMTWTEVHAASMRLHGFPSFIDASVSWPLRSRMTQNYKKIKLGL